VEAGTKDVALRLDAGASLRGTVTDAQTGLPVSAFAISVWRRPDALRVEPVAGAMVVEPTGRFELTGLPEGELRVGVSAQGYAFSGEHRVQTNAATVASVDLRLSRGARLAGSVIDRASRAAIAGARVTVEARSLLTGVGSAVAVRPTALTGADGRFELTGLAAGPLSLLVAASGHHGRIVAGLTAPATGSLPDQTVELSPTQPDEEPKLELAGVGVVLAPKGDGLVVGTVFPTGGGAAAGLVEGDLVLAVDGKRVKDLGFEKTIDAIRGPEGTQVVLSVKRADGSTTELTVTRKVVRG